MIVYSPISSTDTTEVLTIPLRTPTALETLSMIWRNKMGKEKDKKGNEDSNTELIVKGFTSLTNAMSTDRVSSDKKFKDLYDKHDKIKTKVIIIGVVQKGLLGIGSLLLGGLIAWVAANI